MVTLPMPVPPGAVLVYDTRIWHRGGANKAKRKRPVYYITVLGWDGSVPAGLPYTISPEDAGCFVLTARGAEDWYCHGSRSGVYTAA
jgi:ectoine hydroxylase-related dioxygenase (phytanoyl-CoA dioxygenase family)